jgi:hypothetical protein
MSIIDKWRHCLWYVLAAGFLFTSESLGQELVFPDPDWQVVSPEEAGLDSLVLASGFATLPDPGAISLVRDGKLAYTRGTIRQRREMFSISKLLSNLMYGRVRAQGGPYINTVVPGSDYPGVEEATYGQFLTMTSAYAHDPHAPGDHYAYNNDAVHFFGSYLASRFFDTDDAVTAMSRAYMDELGTNDGIGFSGWYSGWDGGGFRLSSRDLARVGLLLLADGLWKGTRVIPDYFVDRLYVSQVPVETLPSPDDEHGSHNETHITPLLPGQYSYAMWLMHEMFPDCVDQPVIAAIGFKWNVLYVIPELSIVLAVTNLYQGAGLFDETRHCTYLQTVFDAARTGGLPVELVSLQATHLENDIELTWTTASEENNAGFVVEQAAVSGGFERVGYVEGAGTSDVRRDYAFRIPDASPGWHRFRLRQIDYSGAFEISPVVDVFVSVPGVYRVSSVYPNPASQSASMEVSVRTAQDIRIDVLDILGRKVNTVSETRRIDPNVTHTFDLNTGSLPAGAYLVRVSGSEFETVRKFVVRR